MNYLRSFCSLIAAFAFQAGLPVAKAATGPAGVTNSLGWDAGQDLGAAFRGLVLLRVQASDNSGSGAWSEPLAYTIIGITDSDGDGMPDSWETLHGLNKEVADASLDKDSDGVDNLMEFALGMNPGVSDLHLIPRLTIEDGYAVLTVERNPDASDLLFTPQHSFTLGTWSSGAAVFTVVEETPTTLKVRLNQPVSAQTVGYIRIKVSNR